MPHTKSSFHIVTQTTDWEHHRKHEQSKVKAALEKTAPIANDRNLETSAERYRPSEHLLDAINAAIAARAPLLITGEPGTGKTQVAWFLKAFFDIPLYEYQVRSTSQSGELRYDFDAVAYLSDAYLNDPLQKPTIEKGKDPRSHEKYLKHGPLWNAYDCEGESLLLIDEIDKASRDFPNDLLQEIDQHRFEHPFEKGRYVERKGPPPLIIITSNSERRLPDAFLRRCIVHNIEIEDILENIMQAWDNSFSLSTEIKDLALHHFKALRKIDTLSKKPAAAELILWLSVLSAQNVSAEQLSEEKTFIELPAMMCLIKDQDDYTQLT